MKERGTSTRETAATDPTTTPKYRSKIQKQ